MRDDHHHRFLGGGGRRGGRAGRSHVRDPRGQARVELQSLWERVRVILVDEVSMIPADLFSQMSARIGDARGAVSG